MRLTKSFLAFFESEKAGGLLLVLVTILSLFLANSPLQISYNNFWNIEFAGHSIIEWINDGLMTVFFLLIGLELEREIYKGELSNLKNAMLPVFAALGGMLIPAGLYILFNYGTSTQNGAGIPMATDIAFAIGILSLLGKQVPASLKIFLTALAVIDDLGAIIIIAVFYTGNLQVTNLLIAFGIFALLLILNRLKIKSLLLYLAAGIFMWYYMLLSGVHPTITGVMLAFVIPFSNGSEKSESYKLQHFLHKPVAFFILPLFALANTSITLENDLYSGFIQPGSVGILTGLIIGKPLGIFIFSFLGVSLGLSHLPPDLKWKNIIGAGMLGGIGFTMSIFITLLAFDKADLINHAKMAIMAASLVSGLIGFFWLKSSLKFTSE